MTWRTLITQIVVRLDRSSCIPIVISFRTNSVQSGQRRMVATTHLSFSPLVADSIAVAEIDPSFLATNAWNNDNPTPRCCALSHAANGGIGC